MPLIAFRIGGLRFESGLGFVLLVVILLVIMLAACRWQWLRAVEKEQILETFRNAQEAELLVIMPPLPEPENLVYRKVRLAGNYLTGRQFLLDNRIVEIDGSKQVGFEVITPFLIDDGPVVLVNRGWVPLGDNRQLLPNIRVDNAQRQIEGMINPMKAGFRIGPMDTNKEWPRLIQYIDYHEIADRLQTPVYSAVLMLAEDEPDGYLRQWRPVIEGPMKHYSYAMQWFLMAVVLLVLFFVFSRYKAHQ